ncbi:hypothetical protein OAH13_01335 [Flavobacteriaceae bacterium]|nr:hypothetical protein [Flavobacteriaceae bacterium]
MKIDQKIFLIDSIGNYKKIIESPTNLNINRFKIIQTSEKAFLLNNSSGIVYEIQSDSIVRIDKSYDDKMHNYSLDFEFRDTIFRFGGYGYFHSHKNLIYFDENSKEWDLVKYKGNSLIEGFSDIDLHFIKDNKLHVFGYKVIDEENQNQLVDSKKGFIYNLDLKSIETTFEINPDFEFSKNYIDINENYLFLLPHRAKNLRILDKNTLELFEYKLNLGETGFSKLHDDNFVVKNNKLIYTSNNLNQDKEIKSFDVTSKINNKSSIPEEIILKSNIGLKTYVIISILITLLSFLFYFKFTKKGLRITHNNLIYKNTKFRIDQNSIKIINLLLSKSRVRNNELNQVFFDEGKNSIHINRQKNKCIDNLNQLFKTETGLTLIHKEKLELDKRIHVYFINLKLLKNNS